MALSGPTGFLSLLVQLLFGRLSDPIWTKWVCIKSCWGAFSNLIGPTWILSLLVPLLFGRLFGPIWTKLIFIPSCLVSLWEAILAYLDPLAVYNFLLDSEKFFGGQIWAPKLSQQPPHLKAIKPWFPDFMIHKIEITKTRL